MIGPASWAEGRRRVVVVGSKNRFFVAVLCSERSACTVGAGIFGLVWLVCSAPRRKVRVQTRPGAFFLEFECEEALFFGPLGFGG